MLDTRKGSKDALERAIEDAIVYGWTLDDIAEMVAAQKLRTLTELARHMAEDSESDDLPTYAEAPPGMIDVATAVKVYGLNARTVKGWIHRGVLPALGKVRGIGGTRFLVCAETVAKMASQPKNKGGRPRKR